MNLANSRSSWNDLIATVQKVRAEHDPTLPEKLVEKVLNIEVLYIGATASSRAGKERMQADTLRKLNSIIEEYVEKGNA